MWLQLSRKIKRIEEKVTFSGQETRSDILDGGR